MTAKKITYRPIIVQMPVPRVELWLSRQRKQAESRTPDQVQTDPTSAAPSSTSKEALDV